MGVKVSVGSGSVSAKLTKGATQESINTAKNEIEAIRDGLEVLASDTESNINTFNNITYPTKLSEFNSNATAKLNEYNSNHSDKLDDIDLYVSINVEPTLDEKVTIATTKANEASVSASNALGSETSALDSKNSALASASTATTKANEASVSATNASNSASSALGYSQDAGVFATSASYSKDTAIAQATIATTQAGIATTKATEASASASSAAISEANSLSYKNQAQVLRDEAEAIYNINSVRYHSGEYVSNDNTTPEDFGTVVITSVFSIEDGVGERTDYAVSSGAIDCGSI